MLSLLERLVLSFSEGWKPQTTLKIRVAWFIFLPSKASDWKWRLWIGLLCYTCITVYYNFYCRDLEKLAPNIHSTTNIPPLLLNSVGLLGLDPATDKSGITTQLHHTHKWTNKVILFVAYSNWGRSKEENYNPSSKVNICVPVKKALFNRSNKMHICFPSKIYVFYTAR